VRHARGLDAGKRAAPGRSGCGHGCSIRIQL
jgi:hypothetical protein